MTPRNPSKWPCSSLTPPPVVNRSHLHTNFFLHSRLSIIVYSKNKYIQIHRYLGDIVTSLVISSPSTTTIFLPFQISWFTPLTILVPDLRTAITDNANPYRYTLMVVGTKPELEQFTHWYDLLTQQHKYFYCVKRPLVMRCLLLNDILPNTVLYWLCDGYFKCSAHRWCTLTVTRRHLQWRALSATQLIPCRNLLVIRPINYPLPF